MIYKIYLYTYVFADDKKDEISKNVRITKVSS